MKMSTNSDYKRVQSLFSNLSSLSLLKIIELRKNYKKLNYSTTELDIQIQKIISYPVYYIFNYNNCISYCLILKEFKR